VGVELRFTRILSRFVQNNSMNTIRVKFEGLDVMIVPTLIVQSTFDGDPICEAIKKELEDIDYVRQLVANKRVQVIIDNTKVLEVEYLFY